MSTTNHGIAMAAGPAPHISSLRRPRFVRSLLVGCIVGVGLLGFSSASHAQMVSPSNDDYIGYWNDAVSFLGSARPGSSVYIQAKNSRGNWVTIATTQAVASGSWAGVWQKSVVIPTSFWDHWGYNSIYEAEVRAAHMSGWRMLPLGNPVTILGWSGGPS